jgi:hypothetical protein
MTPDELDALLKDAALITKEADKGRKYAVNSNPATGKLICVLEERLERSKASMTIAKSTSLATYWQGITGVKMPNHAMTCAVSFGTFVRCELIEEKIYDICSANIIELAGTIVNACKGEVAHEAVHAAAEQLKEHGKDAARNLRAILARVKPRKPMDAEKAQELLKQIFADGHLNLTFAEAAAEMCYLEGDEAKDSYFSLVACGITVDKHFGEQADKWIAEREKFTAKPQLNPGGTPPATPTPTAITLVEAEQKEQAEADETEQEDAAQLQEAV